MLLSCAYRTFARTLGYVNGLVDDAALVGIDYRVQDGLLYGVGNAGGVYSVDSSSGFFESLLVRKTKRPLQLALQRPWKTPTVLSESKGR